MSVWIGISKGVEFGINDEDQLVIHRLAGNGKPLAIVELGPATQTNFDRIIDFMSSIRIHTETHDTSNR